MFPAYSNRRSTGHGNFPLMLKALELVGFKSFADRTRFEFPRGITVVVGPNGSGKSNIVDAIKWVLGEQSVKSLRGHEMADVIFNGSGTRRAMNSAEITLAFDNASRLLPIDTPEVCITRRVYRSGEGEYLINRAPARLRDIRELLSGTGMGTQAYSVIEQGKVDVLLQSSARDRRAIFEEAAGISRFKLKKLEALRRLERVDQNLLRLRDIVDEVEGQLRSVRNQAGKARRYKEYHDRLQELRTQVALVDWARLTEKITAQQEEIRSFDEERQTVTATAELAEARLLEIDTELSDASEAMRQAEARSAQIRERIAAQEASVDHERARHQELEQEIGRHRRQLMALSARDGDLGQQLHETVEAVQAAETYHQQISMRLIEKEKVLGELAVRIEQARTEHEASRAQHLEQLRVAAASTSEITALEAQLIASEQSRERCRNRLSELQQQRASVESRLVDLRRRGEELATEVERLEAQRAAAEEQLEHLQSQLTARRADLSDLQQRYSATAERVDVLDELEKRQEGLGAGVKEALERARAGDSPWNEVCGLVADLLHVSVEVAPLIEVALGAVSQHVVVRPDGQMLAWLRSESAAFDGRIGFVWLPGEGVSGEPLPVDFEGQPGVLGRADRFVDAAPRYAALLRRLLGRTWLVETLDDALRLRNELTAADSDAGRGMGFVTLGGQWVGGDGTVILGAAQTGPGLISRRSQLRALRTQLVELETRRQSAEQAAAALERQISAQTRQLHEQAVRQRHTVALVAEQQSAIAAAETKLAQLESQRNELELEAASADSLHGEAAARLEKSRKTLRSAQARVAELEQRQKVEEEELAAHDHKRHELAAATTQIKVDLAKSEERLGGLHARLRQFEESRQERRRAIGESREQLGQCARRAEAARWNILRAESEIAELYLNKEHYARQTVEFVDRREALRMARATGAAESQRLRGRVRMLEERLHERQLALNEVLLQRNALAERLREDYNQELSELAGGAGLQEDHQRDAVQQEIDELRRKITNLGHVNLEALEELEQLETRFEGLSSQYNDLAAAKASLERIIAKINADSRRLFAETLETVRGHFQTLFRDLFGGGHADIVLEEGVDILESGVEIVARPPGKEPRSISLLSGGEKTLTCVAMLLAVFRSRPSPFCVLDEVDAALDEANIDRFTQVLQGFLSFTQFIMVTHSKKTMTCASTIYGVTMQESGVSKQVSVRFEDVSEDGHIRPERLSELRDEPEEETQAA
ncbi:MAG: chromosome segregation protein SMC [Planctomycetota bacterium]